jgi:hypothetical protein
MLQKRRNSIQIAKGRDFVLSSYDTAKRENDYEYSKGNVKATSEYIYENQIIDANQIVREFYENNRIVNSVSKRTKVGMDGLMIYLAYLMTTHIDDGFIMDPANVRIITGMSNAGWEKDMKEKVPKVFERSIFHHGQLQNAGLAGLKNGLIIIDEIDTGNGTGQKLHNALKEARLLDMNYLKENNIRIMVDSATMMQELYELACWGDLHVNIKMSIPSEYIGHGDFLRMGIIKEFYPLNTPEGATKWVSEDIVDNYGTDYRVHMVRITERGVANRDTIRYLHDACRRVGALFHNHTSSDRLSDAEIKELFEEPLTQHIVLGVKGFFRRANLIPNVWKMRIGATHELHTKKVDNNVQVQAFPGRMSGYWRSVIEGGHKTGPHRTSVKAIEEYEAAYDQPFGVGGYHTATFNKTVRGNVAAAASMLHPLNVENLEAVEGPRLEKEFIGGMQVFKHSAVMIDSDRYLQEVLGHIVSDPELLLTTTYFGKGATRTADGLYKCAIKGQVSDIQLKKTLEDLIPEIEESPGTWFGGGAATAKERGWAVALYYGYDMDGSLYYAVRWIIKNPKYALPVAISPEAANTLVPAVIRRPRGRPPKATAP